MSFGGGFGSNTGGGFSGFGSNNNNTNTTSGASLFGGNTATSGGFGSGGFGTNNATNNSPFGAPKSSFGAPAASTSGGLFGGNTSTTGGFGGTGFGSTNNAGGATLSTGFGASNTNSLFGAKTGTGFGASNTTGGSLFGNNASGGFGSNNNTTSANPFGGASNTTSNPFGGNNNTATGFGSNTANASTAANNSGNNAFGGFGSAANSTTQGTAATPFSPFTEKDAGTTNTSSAYQSITMQQPYQAKSFEELRLEDYAQNRRLPQNNSFGSSNTFGGFGAANNTANQNRPGLFGSTNTATTGFGASNTGFGSNNNNNAGSSLFGAKTGGTSLFGNNAASTTTTGFGSANNASTSLFGGNNNNTTANTTTGFSGGFGANNNANSTSLFGGNNTTNQPKTGFGGFGATNTANTGTGFGGFGGTNNNATAQPTNLFGGQTNTGAFGSNTGSSLFGNTNANKTGTGGLFGAPANNTATGGGLFGNTNTQPTGAFGATAGAPSLFGGNNQAGNNTTNSLFSNNQQNKTGGTGLFGAPQPAAGNSLFGGANANNTAGTSLFGGNNANNNANAGTSLFGNTNKAAGSSLFGGNTGGSSLFGNTNAQAGNSLFSNNNNNAQAGNSLFGGAPNQNNNSLFGNSQGQQQQNQLTASITGDPYGNAQLFASLAAPSPPVGPLATPLSGAKPAPRARASLLASVRGGSPMLGASTSLTPRNRPGYGFSYSNYNTPTANTPQLTPGASSLLRPTGSLGSALSSRLSKSFSTSNLRGDNADGHSLVRTPVPGQGSLLLGSGSLGSGSVRRLKIDRSLRSDLFGDSQKKPSETPKEADKEPELRKRVSFDKSAEKEGGSITPKPSAANALVVRDDDADKTPEMSQVSSTSLTTVPEESNGDKISAQSPRRPVEAGEYFTEPPLKQIKNMSRGQLSTLKKFAVGRQGVGKIEFGRNGELDLSTVPLDDICGKIVQLKPRSATVYEDDSDKPPVGRGLNVPSTIYLEQSWPRASRHSTASQQKTSQKEIDRHKARLKRVGGTKFLDYNDNTGIWSFTVEHFTTYELDDDDETTMQDTTNVSDAQPASAQSASSGHSDAQADQSFDTEGMDSPDLGEQDDTFQFKIAKRSQQSNLSLPGGFEDSMPNITHDHNDASADEMQEDDFVQAGGLGDSAMSDPFIEAAGAVQPPSPDTLARYRQSFDQDDDMEEDQDLPGAYHDDADGLKGILKPSNYNESLFGATENLADLPWEDQLQRTLSPKKRDRQALRDAQSAHAKKTEAAPDSLLKRSLLSRSQLGQSYLATKSAKKTATEKPRTKAFTTSMDIMNSLWADEKQASTRAKSSVQAHKASRSHTANDDPKKLEEQFRDSFKPSFTNNGTLVFTSTTAALKPSFRGNVPIKPILGNHRDIAFYHSQVDEDLDAPALKQIQKSTQHTLVESVDMEIDEDEEDEPIMPSAITSNRIMFRYLAHSVQATSDAAKHEKAIWSLCSVLFDPLEICAAEIVDGMSEQLIDEYQSRIRKDAFLALWSEQLKESTQQQLKSASSAEEKAILLLAIGDIAAASETLMHARNTKLAILVAQLSSGSTSRELITHQISSWKQRNDWSEFSDGQRALYSILAGNTCLVEGTKGTSENQTAEFHLSDKFDLSWQQSLALRVRYAGIEGFPQAVEAFVADLDAGIEHVSTAPWHGNADHAVHTELTLLKIIIDQASAEALLDPLTVSGDAAHNRLAWQLAVLLGARGILQPSDDQMDALTIDLATEQEDAGSYLDALWTLLHLNDNAPRYLATKAVLERNSGRLPDPAGEDGHGEFEILVQDLQIPASLVWAAKALDAQGTQHDPIRQCRYLLYTATPEGYKEAHDVLCNKIGPTAVIEEYYDDVFVLLQHFEQIGTVHFESWETGGQIYLWLCQLLQLSPAKSKGREAEALLKKLDRGLETQEASGSRGLSLEGRVARIEMRRIVNEEVKQIADAEKWFSQARSGDARSNKGSAMLGAYMRALGEVH